LSIFCNIGAVRVAGQRIADSPAAGLNPEPLNLYPPAMIFILCPLTYQLSSISYALARNTYRANVAKN